MSIPKNYKSKLREKYQNWEGNCKKSKEQIRYWFSSWKN